MALDKNLYRAEARILWQSFPDACQPVWVNQSTLTPAGCPTARALIVQLAFEAMRDPGNSYKANEAVVAYRNCEGCPFAGAVCMGASVELDAQ